jgi:tripartite ATP-independent transporter DctM subunit
MLLMVLVLILLIFLGIPIAFSLGFAGMMYFIIHPDLLNMMAQRIWAGANMNVMTALPLFIIAGYIMNRGGITRRIIDFSMDLMRPLKGGLGEVNVIASMIFGGISGSSVSDTSALGSVLIPEMEKRGYSREFATGVTVGSSTVGMIIPPSIPMIIFSIISGASVGHLFLAGLIPGILIGVTQLILTYIISRRRNYPIATGKFELKEFARNSFNGALSLLMPVFIVLSVSLGVATATEAAGVAVFYALLIGFLVYKELRLKDLKSILKDGVLASSTIMFIVAYAFIFTWILAFEQIPNMLGDFILGLNISYYWILIIIDILLLIVGMFIDVGPALLLLGPILVPVMGHLGMDMLQLATILIVGLGIGLATPPVGACLNAASRISKMEILDIAKATLPFLICNLIVLLLVTFIPAISLWVPSLFF